MTNQKAPKFASKFGKPLGGSLFTGPKKEDNKNAKQVGGFDPARFKTQHKG
ncbi:MAG TPA: hypothetical protein VG895_01965 [Patescibacteria group bacterium]|nr:hypothetical protein [Patescibacteria group bacterium]